jgi:hypothetical protein
MSSAYSTAPRGLTDSDDMTRRQLVRVILAATMGSAAEWYSFVLYGLAASTVFSKLFFPASALAR